MGAPAPRPWSARRLLSGPEARTFILLILVLVFGALKEPQLLSPLSINGILLWIPLLTVMAVGQMFVIVTRGIDVSVGSTLGLTGMLVGMLLKTHPEFNLAFAVGISLGIGACLGFVNGALIAWAKIPPIITTLGTLSAYRGITFIVSHGVQVDPSGIPSALTSWSLAGPVQVGGVVVPWLIVLALVVAAIGHIFTGRTLGGRAMYAVGGNPEAAHAHGLSVGRTVLLAYVGCGALAGLAGILYASRYGFVNPESAGKGMELTVIAAAVIGGCDVRGGEGSVLGVVLGCVLLGTISVALAVLGVPENWQLLVFGAVILIALGLNAAMGRRQAFA